MPLVVAGVTGFELALSAGLEEMPVAGMLRDRLEIHPLRRRRCRYALRASLVDRRLRIGHAAHLTSIRPSS